MDISDHHEEVISKYLSGNLSRAEAVDELGEETVERVEDAQEAIEEDVAWGLGKE